MPPILRIRPARTLLVLLATSVIATPGIDAQTRVRLVPSAGWFLPTSLLYETDFSPGLVNPVRAELGPAPVVGVGLHAIAPDALFSARLTLERTLSLETEVTGRDPVVGAPEEAWPTHPFIVPTTITMITGDVLLHPDRREFWMDPYLFVGVGWKWYSFGSEEPADEVGFDFPQDGSSARIHYGAGMELQLRRLPLSAEAGGNFNRFVLVDDEQGLSRSRSQHEFTLAVKAFLPIFSF